ncbi:VanZ family protein [Haloimpatiens sp. FM7315]|uniref:VanZ family protein n=1 Tax=Haloimpatiens sp. FM7315 TaxID=3298609 RepID=UPI0035A2D958
MNKSRKIIIIVAMIFCIFWMGFIFFNSSNNGKTSNNKSHWVLRSIKTKYREINIGKYINNIFKGSLKDKVEDKIKKGDNANVYLRKAAHVFEYFALSLIITLILFLLKLKILDRMVYSLFICLLYAVFDEFHQYFVGGRSSSVLDVIIDFSGAIIGAALTNIIIVVINFVKNK